MDEPKNSTVSRYEKRAGFALLITLSVLAVLMGLTGILLGYFDMVRKDAVTTKALIQGNLYYVDIKKIIKGFKDKKTLYTTLYMMPLPLESPDKKFNMILNCHPRANGININWLAYEDSNKMFEKYNLAEKVFESIVQNYEIEDATRLKELLLQEIKADKTNWIGKEDSRLLQKNGIISLKQFESVLARYQFEVDDTEISKIPWKKYFVFYPDMEKIDGDYLSGELISVLFDMDPQLVKDEWVQGTTKLKNFVQNSGESYNPKIFTEEFIEEAECEVQYAYRDERFAFTFIDSDGEVKNFEFNGKQ
jgi:hypothetical protein